MANALSLLRLLLVAPFAWLLARGDATSAPWAVALFWIAVASDLADGPLARARGTASAFGRALDHAADFAFVDAGLFAAAARGALPWLLPVLVAAAFAQYVADSYWLERAGQLRMSRLGRWNGVLYFVPVGALALADLGVPLLGSAVRPFAWALCATTLASIADRALSLRRVESA